MNFPFRIQLFEQSAKVECIEANTKQINKMTSLSIFIYPSLFGFTFFIQVNQNETNNLNTICQKTKMCTRLVIGR